MDFDFMSQIMGCPVSKEYIPGVQKGIDSIPGGIVCDYLVLGTKTTLIDGNYHCATLRS